MAPVPVVDRGGGRATATADGLAPGGYELRVSSSFPSEATVVAPFVVLDPA